MAQAGNRPRKTETLISLVILAALAGIAACVLVAQSHYDPAIFSGQAQSEGKSAQADTPGLPLASFAPPQLAPAGKAERFDRETLSDKIDGKAETYLPLGFLSMDCQRFAFRDRPGDLAEVFVFDMVEPANAYSVYSVQVRQGAPKLDLGERAYRTQNAVYFTHGQYYVEMVGTSGDLLAPMEAMGRSFVAGVRAKKPQVMEELSLFPPEGLKADSIIRASVEDFGVAGFENVFRATYQVGGKQVTAFLARQADAAKASELASEYLKFYQQYGGKEQPAGPETPTARLLDMDGILKIVFSRGPFVAGVDQADDRAAAQVVAGLLYRKLAEVGK